MPVPPNRKLLSQSRLLTPVSLDGVVWPATAAAAGQLAAMLHLQCGGSGVVVVVGAVDASALDLTAFTCTLDKCIIVMVVVWRGGGCEGDALVGRPPPLNVLPL